MNNERVNSQDNCTYSWLPSRCHRRREDENTSGYHVKHAHTYDIMNIIHLFWFSFITLAYVIRIHHWCRICTYRYSNLENKNFKNAAQLFIMRLWAMQRELAFPVEIASSCVLSRKCSIKNTREIQSARGNNARYLQRALYPVASKLCMLLVISSYFV